MIYYQKLSLHVSSIYIPIFRSRGCMLLHMVFRWACRCLKHVEVILVIYHNCCSKLVPLVYPYHICYCEDCNKVNKSKVHFLFLHTVKAYGGVALLLQSFKMSALDGSELLVSRPCLCSLGKGYTVSTE